MTVMNGRRLHRWWLIIVVAALGITFGLHRAIAGEGDTREGMQVLTRGPVHEAFAETVTFDPQPGIVVPKTPPAPIGCNDQSRSDTPFQTPIDRDHSGVGQ